ncbi:MAG: NAD metabolism ATPase/kinase [Flavobacterium sp.]|uniref:DUF4301 family protein n=1 Tax=Flavobacterium sp. TaxID=239 RepID=UPI000C4E8A0C|nr:DUF4301 family protein [Flavobacterium sp.]MBF01820.1 NAD metabolism ATPase/kinase [Flavobacterium sp.]|tara:strand:- start:63 stop:1598 length:1536 start_codon:yes stop_codon:yes gene_type:complete
MEEKFSELDLKQIQDKGISIEKILQQFYFFENGIPKANLVRSATKGDGIWVLSGEEKENFIVVFNEKKHLFDIQKFVPASGAASRMFQFLSEFLNEYDYKNETINAYINRKKASELSVFLIGLKNFPFYPKLKEKTIAIYPDYFSNERDVKDYFLIKTLLSEAHFDFANKPKGILPFHKKKNSIYSPVEEHLEETLFYRVNSIKPKVHFTISENHLESFKEITSKYDTVEIDFSYQESYTDTLAVTKNNEPFRKEDGTLLFRPGGHGALIENLNRLNTDLIFIKNIDNVSQNHLSEIVQYKKLLGGILIAIQEQVFAFLRALDKKTLGNQELNKIVSFVEEKLNINLPVDFDKYKKTYKSEVLFEILNRPIRVCGMVKNEGEPGGGPFWVKNEKGIITLQIIENTQVDFTNEKQVEIFNKSTHFNPVDLVCGVKNFKGKKFNLLRYVDENMGFIVEKTKNGKSYKAFELPGLWNGAMGFWNTIFVEVPLTTFNPVKTVNDLLKPAHQPENE